MKILAFGGSNSKHSINKKLAINVASMFPTATVEIIDINDFPLPLFSVDVEQEIGTPENVLKFASKIDQTDLIVLSLAENNGSYNVGFKNLLDWTSRIANRKTWGNKDMLLMATSPGARGGIDVLTAAKNRFPFMGANIKATFSLPSFYDNFNTENGITNSELKTQIEEIVHQINEA